MDATPHTEAAVKHRQTRITVHEFFSNLKVFIKMAYCFFSEGSNYRFVYRKLVVT
jgi:hypothetical protein